MRDVIMDYPKNNPKEIKYWIIDLKKNVHLKEIIKSEAFCRLENISFLGAIDYTYNKKNKSNNRKVHSLYVAALANYIATERGYSKELKQSLIIAALLHDIGHPPLSHSIEPFLKKEIGYGHHELGAQIIKGEVKLGKSLNKYLMNITNIDFINDLINGVVCDSDGGDLFKNKINIDTIDGISRSLLFLENKEMDHSLIDIAKAAFVEKSDNEYKYLVLDYFWKTKDYIYKTLIHGKQGLLSDKIAEVYFFSYAKEKFKVDDLFEDEYKWRKIEKYADLFIYFKKYVKSKQIPSWLNYEVEYTKRDYTINKRSFSSSRFQCSKERKKVQLNVSEEQLQSYWDFL